MSQRSLVELTSEDCFALLGGVRIGRLAYCDEIGPVAIPVNFALAGQDIVFRMEPDNTALASALDMVAFEADHVDDTQDSGWSVVVRGRLATVDLDDVPMLLRQLSAGPPRPWAAGVHNVWIRIRPELVTGRRLGERSDPLVV
jgi:uncharacterized protein